MNGVNILLFVLLVFWSEPTHVLNLQHAFRVLFHEVHFVGVSAIDWLHFITHIVTLGVVVLVMSHWRNVARGLSMRVWWEDLREGVTHLQLAVKCSVHGSLSRVKTAVLTGSLHSWWSVIVFEVTQGALLEVRGLLSVGWQVPLVMFVCLNQCLNLSHGHVELLEVGGVLFSLGSSGWGCPRWAVGRFLNARPSILLHHITALSHELRKMNGLVLIFQESTYGWLGCYLVLVEDRHRLWVGTAMLWCPFSHFLLPSWLLEFEGLMSIQNFYL